MNAMLHSTLSFYSFSILIEFITLTSYLAADPSHSWTVKRPIPHAQVHLLSYSHAGDGDGRVDAVDIQKVNFSLLPPPAVPHLPAFSSSGRSEPISRSRSVELEADSEVKGRAGGGGVHQRGVSPSQRSDGPLSQLSSLS